MTAAIVTDYPVQVCFNVPSGRVQELLSAALDAPPVYGAGYWAELIETKGKLFGKPGESGCMVFRAHCDGQPYVHSDGRKVFVLDAATVQAGLRIMATTCSDLFAQWMNDDEDGACGDVFLQCCLFGSVVFS